MIRISWMIIVVSGCIDSSTGRASKMSRAIGDCGQIKPGRYRQSKILNGEDSEPNEFPWIVSIRTKNELSASASHFCGGFVIDNRHIVSAAHCFRKKYNSHNHQDFNDDGVLLPGSMTVSLGQHDLTVETSQNATIESIELHPDFEVGGYLSNDIAILRTTQVMIWDSTLHPICLPNDDDPLEGARVVVAGWGNINCHNTITRPSKTLKKVTIPMWANGDCLKAYKDANYDFTREDYLCAGEHDKDSSKGDSGSPLMMLRNNRWTAVGIVSAGRFMCEDKVPGLYTKIQSYLNWITSQVNMIT